MDRVTIGITNQFMCTIVYFKRLGSRHINKEIKLEKAMNGRDMILCKTDLILIRGHTYKCTTGSDVDFEEFFKSAYVPLWYPQFQKGVASFYVMISI